jgi:hypothetical protein
VRRRLSSLAPQWLDTGERAPGAQVIGSRYGMGVSFRCPAHPDMDHRIELWFLNPFDTQPPKPSHSLFFVTGQDFENMTLTTGLVAVDSRRPMAEHIFGEHWRGYLFDGWVIDALRIG